MYKVLIIDDEPLARSVVKNYLGEFESIEVIGEYGNGFEGFKAIEEHQPDLIFLDIQMPKLNGFEMLELIENPPSVIFTTAFDEYAVKAFEASAVDYLLKPFDQERFKKAISKWMNSTSSSEISTFSIQPDELSRIVIKDGSSIQVLPLDEVIMIEAYDDYVKIHTKDKYYLKNKTMSYYEDLLKKKDFLRIHRSYIINLNELTKIDSFEKNSYRASLTNGSVVPISRTAYTELKTVLGL